MIRLWTAADELQCQSVFKFGQDRSTLLLIEGGGCLSGVCQFMGDTMFGLAKRRSVVSPTQRVYWGNKLADKIEGIREKHHRKYVVRLWKMKAAAIACVFAAIPITFMLLDNNLLNAGLFVAFILYMTYEFILNSIFKLGNSDDREYFLSCIDAADDEYELEAMGFNRIEKIEEIIKNVHFEFCSRHHLSY